MRISKALLFLSAFTLVACGTQKSSSVSENKESTSNVESTSVVTSSESTTNEASTSSVASTTSSTSVATSSTTSSTSSAKPLPVDNTLTFSFLNPSCGSQGTNSLNAKLKDEMNTAAGTEFVTGVTNTACQFMADAPVKNSQILTIGSSKNAGTLEITFKETIKSLKITVETYNKTYTQSGQDVTNVDANSVLYFNTDSNAIDLKPVDGKAVTKEYEAAINATSFKVYNKGSGSRVFVKSLTVTY